jgi:hypothetical protein
MRREISSSIDETDEEEAEEIAINNPLAPSPFPSPPSPFYPLPLGGRGRGEEG